MEKRVLCNPLKPNDYGKDIRSDEDWAYEGAGEEAKQYIGDLTEEEAIEAFLSYGAT